MRGSWIRWGWVAGLGVFCSVAAFGTIYCGQVALFRGEPEAPYDCEPEPIFGACDSLWYLTHQCDPHWVDGYCGEGTPEPEYTGCLLDDWEEPAGRLYCKDNEYNWDCHCEAEGVATIMVGGKIAINIGFTCE